jgi:hypothetical protein
LLQGTIQYLHARVPTLVNILKDRPIIFFLQKDSRHKYIELEEQKAVTCNNFTFTTTFML